MPLYCLNRKAQQSKKSLITINTYSRCFKNMALFKRLQCSVICKLYCTSALNVARLNFFLLVLFYFCVIILLLSTMLFPNKEISNETGKAKKINRNALSFILYWILLPNCCILTEIVCKVIFFFLFVILIGYILCV